MRDEPLDEQYLRWLYGLVNPVTLKNPSKTYWSLMRLLYQKEFAWSIHNDENREEDGHELRYEFMSDCHIRIVDECWLGLPCSVVEMLISLARRLTYEDGREMEAWFWEMVENLGLTEYNDLTLHAADQKIEIEQTLDRLVGRSYSHNGEGGLFPLSYSEEDQRDVEIWYQACAYLAERA